jgi:hypothetical protein
MRQTVTTAERELCGMYAHSGAAVVTGLSAWTATRRTDGKQK